MKKEVGYVSKKDQEYLRRLSEAVSERLQKQQVPVEAEPVYNLVSQPLMYKEIEFLRRHGMNDRIIYDMVGRGVVDAMRGKSPSITQERVARAVYEEVRENDRYEKIAKELGRLLGEKDIGDIEKRVGRKLKIRRKESAGAAGALEEILRKAAVYLPFILAVGFLLKGFIIASVTGAVIGGGGGTADLNVLFGIGFFLLGLAIHHFKTA